jgi:hypothetical protein
MIKVCVIQTFFCKNQLIVIFVINRNYSAILGNPANNLVCFRRINRTTFHMSVTWKFDKVIFQTIFYISIKVLISFAWLDFT